MVLTSLPARLLSYWVEGAAVQSLSNHVSFQSSIELRTRAIMPSQPIKRRHPLMPLEHRSQLRAPVMNTDDITESVLFFVIKHYGDHGWPD